MLINTEGFLALTVLLSRDAAGMLRAKEELF